MNFFDIETIAFTVLNYQVSYIELLGTLFGLISVYYASRANILTWPSGIFNELFLFLLFFQVQLYADMFLQVYFFAVTLYGWYQWNAKTAENKITRLSVSVRWRLVLLIFAGTLLAGFIIKNIHLYLPQYFKIEASFPFIDSFVMVCSIVATVLLSRKRIENWYLWIIIDVVCTGLYFKKGIYFLALEYLIFLCLASYGLFYWKKQLKHD